MPLMYHVASDKIVKGRILPHAVGDCFEVIESLQVGRYDANSHQWKFDEFRFLEPGERFVVSRVSNIYRLEMLIWGERYTIENQWFNSHYVKVLGS